MVYAIFKAERQGEGGKAESLRASTNGILNRLMAEQVDELFSSAWRSAQQQLNRMLIQIVIITCRKKKKAGFGVGTSTCCSSCLSPSEESLSLTLTSNSCVSAAQRSFQRRAVYIVTLLCASFSSFLWKKDLFTFRRGGGGRNGKWQHHPAVTVCGIQAGRTTGDDNFQH